MLSKPVHNKRLVAFAGRGRSSASLAGSLPLILITTLSLLVPVVLASSSTPAQAIERNSSSLAPVAVSLSTARSIDSRHGCAIRFTGKTVPYIAGSVVKMRSLDGLSLGKATVKLSGSAGHFTIRKVLECAQSLLVRPVASGTDARGQQVALRGIGLARTLVIPARPSPSGTGLLGPSQAMSVIVIDHEAAAFPGQIPTICPDVSVAPGDPITVEDTATGARVGVGAVGACTGYTTTSGSVCVPGIGCLPALSAPVYAAQLFGALPILPSYTFRIGSHQQTVDLADAQAAHWALRLGVSNS